MEAGGPFVNSQSAKQVRSFSPLIMLLLSPGISLPLFGIFAGGLDQVDAQVGVMALNTSPGLPPNRLDPPPAKVGTEGPGKWMVKGQGEPGLGRGRGERQGRGNEQSARRPCGRGWVIVAGGGAGLGVAGDVVRRRGQTRPGGPGLIVPPTGMLEGAAMVAGCYAQATPLPLIPSDPPRGMITSVQEIYFFCNKISL